MVRTQAAAVDVEREVAVGRAERSALDERSTLAFLTEAEVLDGLEYRDRERVVDRRVVDVFELMAALNEEVAAARKDTGRSEAEIRAIVRDELEEAGVIGDGLE